MKPRPICPPARVWFVFGPDGRPRDCFLHKPDKSAIGWTFLADKARAAGTPRTNMMRPNEDVPAAKAAGYRLKSFPVKP